MTKAGTIILLIIFIFESIFIFPLLWTIPAFIKIKKINNNIATDNDKIVLSVLGFIFSPLLGWVASLLILVDLNNNKTTKVAVTN